MEIQVIGQARTAWSRRQDAPHQPRAAAEVVGAPPSPAHVCSPAIVHHPCTPAAECARPSHHETSLIPIATHALPTPASPRHVPRVGCATHSHQHRRGPHT